MVIIDFMRTMIFLILCCLMPVTAFAGNDTKSFCLEELFNDPAYHGILDTINFSHHDALILYLGPKFTGTPFILSGNKIVKLEGGFPSNYARDRFVELEDGRILGLSTEPFQRGIYEYAPSELKFKLLEVDGGDKIHSVAAFVKSDVMGGALISIQEQTKNKGKPKGSVYLLKDNKVSRISGIDEWITAIFDFPEIQMTFLGSEFTDRIYLIDAHRNVHDVVALDRGDWIFFLKAKYEPHPDRLEIFLKEALGPYQEKYILPLKNENRACIPDVPSFNDRLASLFKKESPAQPCIRKDAVSLPIIKNIYANLPYAFPATGNEISFEEDGIYNLAKNGSKHRIKKIDIAKSYGWRMMPLASGSELLISAQKKLYVLKDGDVKGNCH